MDTDYDKTLLESCWTIYFEAYENLLLLEWWLLWLWLALVLHRCFTLLGALCMLIYLTCPVTWFWMWLVMIIMVYGYGFSFLFLFCLIYWTSHGSILLINFITNVLGMFTVKVTSSFFPNHDHFYFREQVYSKWKENQTEQKLGYLQLFIQSGLPKGEFCSKFFRYEITRVIFNAVIIIFLLDNGGRAAVIRHNWSVGRNIVTWQFVIHYGFLPAILFTLWNMVISLVDSN